MTKANDLVSGETVTGISSITYTVNPIGQRTHATRTGAATNGTEWGYDTLGQITSADDTNPAGEVLVSCLYDAQSRLISRSVGVSPTITTAYIHDGWNRIAEYEINTQPSHRTAVKIFSSLSSMRRHAKLAFWVLFLAGCASKEAVERRQRFAILGLEDHGEQLLGYDQIQVSVVKRNSREIVILSSTDNDTVVGCGTAFLGDPEILTIDQVVCISNGGNGRFEFENDNHANMIDYMDENGERRPLWTRSENSGAKKMNPRANQ